jgi:branched-chain amino acid transport system substrate-binding protein
VRNYVGIGGTFNMTPEDHSGLGNKGGAMLQIKDGKFVLVQ